MKAAAVMAESEGKKSAGKAAKKATKAKKALKRMVSEIDAEDASEYALQGWHPWHAAYWLVDCNNTEHHSFGAIMHILSSLD